MFKKLIAMIIIAFLVSGVILYKNWDIQEEVALVASHGVIRPNELRQELGGKWGDFPSLRTAWTIINENKQQKSIVLPSNRTFKIAARKFRIPSEWSSRDMILTLRGVDGKATIYLNGVSLKHQVAVFQGNGGSYEVSIPPTAFHYGQDNILLIEMNPSNYRTNSIFGFGWPQGGKLTGSITLDAVMENISEPEVVVRWEEENATVVVKTILLNSRFMDNSGWKLEGVLSDGSAEIANNSVRIEKESLAAYKTELSFKVDQPRIWSLEDPFLYHLLLTITNDKGDSDRLSLTFGLRKLVFRNGFQLNNKETPIKGLFLSSESEALIRNSGELSKWLKGIREKGYNLVYFAKFPDELWFEVADRVGIGIWTEFPVSFIPTQNLPDPDNFKNLVITTSKHPSLWGWTVGKGIGPLPSDKLETYWSKTIKMTGEVPGFMLQPPLGNFKQASEINLGKSIPPNQIIPVMNNTIKMDWVEVIPYTEKTSNPMVGSWKKGEPIISKILALLSIVILILNTQSIGWRYKELNNEKPKRPLRKSWFWCGVHFLTRQTAWAAILTSVLYSFDPAEWSFFVEVWPFWIEILRQSPWLLWLNLSLLFMMYRILQIGVVAPLLPGSPHTLGLIYWMERRYRWFGLVTILWAVAPYFGILSYIPPLVYLVFSLLFLPMRIRDVRKAGGNYRGFLLVPALIILVPLGWGMWRWEDLVYLWDWIYTLALPILTYMR